MTVTNIAVVGAGAVGLSTARRILETVPDVRVTVVAEKFLEETTSTGAGGHFRPSVDHLPGVNREKNIEWSKVSRDYFFDLAASSNSRTSGCIFESGYLLHDDDRVAVLPEVVLHFRKLSPEEMKSLNFTARHGYVYTTVVTEMKKYLPWLTARVTELGGKLQRRKLLSLHELIGEYDIVVNCCGLGARELVNDTNIHAVRGHLVMVRAPWIRHFYTYEGRGLSTYVYPNSECVILGGVRQVGQENLEPDPETTEDIIRRTTALVPALKGATVIGSWVGLRPTRKPLRLESEQISNHRGQIQVVHNYGHGAQGIALSWGTAVEATKLVLGCMRNLHKSKL